MIVLDCKDPEKWQRAFGLFLTERSVKANTGTSLMTVWNFIVLQAKFDGYMHLNEPHLRIS